VLYPCIFVRGQIPMPLERSSNLSLGTMASRKRDSQSWGC
jgi:hypothetical protein